MSKIKNINKIINMLATALRHEIGALVDIEELYVDKYKKEANARIKRASDIIKKCNFNIDDKYSIKIRLKEKLQKDLENRDYISDEKFDIVDEEVDKVLRELDLL